MDAIRQYRKKRWLLSAKQFFWPTLSTHFSMQYWLTISAFFVIWNIIAIQNGYHNPFLNDEMANVSRNLVNAIQNVFWIVFSKIS